MTTCSGRVEVGGRDDGEGDVGAGGVGFGWGGVDRRGGGGLVGEAWAQRSLTSVSAEAEDGGHGALAGGDGLLHELAAEADGADGVGKVEGAGGDVGGILAERVAGGEGGGEVGQGSDRTRQAATETVRMAGWVCSVCCRVSAGPLKMRSERGSRGLRRPRRRRLWRRGSGRRARGPCRRIGSPGRGKGVRV